MRICQVSLLEKGLGVLASLGRSLPQERVLHLRGLLSPRRPSAHHWHGLLPAVRLLTQTRTLFPSTTNFQRAARIPRARRSKQHHAETVRAGGALLLAGLANAPSRCGNLASLRLFLRLQVGCLYAIPASPCVVPSHRRQQCASWRPRRKPPAGSVSPLGPVIAPCSRMVAWRHADWSRKLGESHQHTPNA